MCKIRYLGGGEGGIRTLGPPQGGQRFSRPPRSTAPAPLRALAYGAGMPPPRSEEGADTSRTATRPQLRRRACGRQNGGGPTTSQRQHRTISATSLSSIKEANCAPPQISNNL